MALKHQTLIRMYHIAHSNGKKPKMNKMLYYIIAKH
jgi:hypothetical protein